MKSKKQKLDMIKKKRPDLLKGKDENTLSDQEIDTLVRMAADLSMDDIEDLLRQAIHTRFDKAQAGSDLIESSAYIEEVYPAYLIYELEARHYKIAWSILDGKVTLGDTSVEVIQTWSEAQAAAMGLSLDEHVSIDECSLVVRMEQAKNPEGTVWDVLVCEPRFTKNGFYMTEDMLSRADTAAAFEGLDVNLYELPNGATHVPSPLFDLKSLLVKNKVGWLDNVKYAAGRGLMGVVHFLDNAKWMGKNMLAAMDKGKSVYGLSWDAKIRGVQTQIDGKPVIRIDGFNRADSLDVVSRPAAGGKFIRAVAGLPLAHNEEDISMKQLLALIKQKRPDLLKGKDEATLTNQDIETLVRMVMETPADGGIDKDKLVTKDELAVIRCSMDLDKKLGDPKLGLPQVSIERIMKTFEGRAFASADLNTAIAGEKEFLGKYHESLKQNGVEGIPGSSVTGGLGSFDRACMAVDKMFGMKKEDMVKSTKLTRLDGKKYFSDLRSVQDYDGFDDVPTFSSLREMYTHFTGDAEVTGIFKRKNLSADMRSSMDVNSSTFTYVLGNTLGRRLVNIYRSMAYLTELIISIKKPVKDFRPQEAIMIGGFPDLADVDPESGNYQEIGGVTDEESKYSVGQKGNILTTTRKTIINDDISVIQRMVDNLGRAAARTHAKYAWSMVISNANCSDGTAIFTTGHGNLGATALSHATALIAYKALASMTEKDSGERLGLLSDPSVKPNLIGPVDLIDTIDKIANEDFYYTSNDLTTKTPNTLRNKINGVTHPLFTDVNDWLMLLPPNMCDMIEMGYLNGREDPELLVADMPQSEQVFVADRIRHKIRHEYAGAWIDFRGGYKAVMA